MSTNLVASAAKLLTPELMSRIASALGIDSSTIEKALTAGVPGLLAAFTSLVSRPGGAARLADAVAQQPPGILTSIANAGPASQRDLIDSGVGTLSSLLGGNTMSALSGALSRYAGLGDAGSKGVLGLLGPLVMGVLGQEQRASGLDASGLAQMLQSQKSNFMRALPSGFSRQLGDAGVIDQVTSAATSSKARYREEADYGSGSQWNWVLPVLGLLALGALAWYLLGRNPDRTVATLPTTNAEAPAMATRARDFIVTAEEEKGWMGRPVFSNDNQKVGEIIDIKRGPDNKVTDIYFDAGTFLGMGAKRYHITADQIEEVKPNGVVVTMKEADIKAMPPSAQK